MYSLVLFKCGLSSSRISREFLFVETLPALCLIRLSVGDKSHAELLARGRALQRVPVFVTFVLSEAPTVKQGHWSKSSRQHASQIFRPPSVLCFYG